MDGDTVGEDGNGQRLEIFWDTEAASVEEALARIVKGVSALTTTQGLGRKPVSQIVADAERHLDALDGMLTKGDWLVGGIFQLNTAKTNTHIGLTPMGGKFVVKNLAVEKAATR